MQTQLRSLSPEARHYPSFDLMRLLKTNFLPKKGEKVCILIDLDHPEEIKDFAFLKRTDTPVQKKAHDIFYQGILKKLQELGLKECKLFAYKKTGGSNLELPETAMTPEGKSVRFDKEIYPAFNIILCFTTFSATAPLTAAAKKFGFRGATMHGVNETILRTGLAVDYHDVSAQTEKMRAAMSYAEGADIEFALDGKKYQLHIDLGRQNAQKSHGICHDSPDVVNLPAGEVYFVPTDASGSFPIKLDDGTLGIMEVQDCKVSHMQFLRGDKHLVDRINKKLKADPATGILGELGFGTQILPNSGADIQDEKIFGTFHLATGRNDHLNGSVTLDKFKEKKNATHEDILFSPTKTPEIHIKRVSLKHKGKENILIENDEPTPYYCHLQNP